jgi:hypothetical protein
MMDKGRQVAGRGLKQLVQYNNYLITMIEYTTMIEHITMIEHRVRMNSFNQRPQLIRVCVDI